MRLKLPDRLFNWLILAVSTPSSPFQILGEAGIKNLVSTFYDIMDSTPEVAELRKLHAEDLSPMKEKLAEYLVGWMGGPPVYAEKYGSVCMTEPHAPYAIGPKLRDQWLLCMEKALEQTEASEELRTMLKVPLFRIADAVRNRDDDRPDTKPGGDIICSSRN